MADHDPPYRPASCPPCEFAEPHGQRLMTTVRPIKISAFAVEGRPRARGLHDSNRRVQSSTATLARPCFNKQWAFPLNCPNRSVDRARLYLPPVRDSVFVSGHHLCVRYRKGSATEA